MAALFYVYNQVPEANTAGRNKGDLFKVKLLYILAGSLILIIALTSCAIEQTTASQIATPTDDGQFSDIISSLDQYPTVRSIRWGQVPYDRDRYSSDRWRTVRDEVCNSAQSGFFSDQPFSSEQRCEADHVMSVSEAHHRGASSLSASDKRSFYLDASNLVASRSEVNRAKSNRTPAQIYSGSEPERHAFDAPIRDCEYVAIWLSTLVRYKLAITQAELSSGKAFLENCQ